jgi:hypothetical protein
MTSALPHHLDEQLDICTSLFDDIALAGKCRLPAR